MTSLNVYPEDALEHELESLSHWIRTGYQSWVPAEVRIREEEGTHTRPELIFSISSVGLSDSSSTYYRETRVANVTWYGAPSDSIVDHHREAWRATLNLTRALTRNDQRYRGLVQILDWANPENPVTTDHWIEIDMDSVVGTPVRDENGTWMAPVDFEYSVERGHEITGTAITTVSKKVVTLV